MQKKKVGMVQSLELAWLGQHCLCEIDDRELCTNLWVRIYFQMLNQQPLSFSLCSGLSHNIFFPEQNLYILCFVAANSFGTSKGINRMG